MAVSRRQVESQSSPTLSRGCMEDYEIFCQPCDLVDRRLPAFGFCKDCEEHLCESCFKNHRMTKPTRYHILLDENNMPQTLRVPSEPANADQSNDLPTPCPEHKQEIIKFFCHDHETLQCNVCVTLDHTRTSCQVDYIPDISKKSLESKETLKDLEKVIERYKKAIVELKEKFCKSAKSLKDVLAEIKSFRQEINQRIDELEKKAIERAKDLQKENNTILKRAEKTCNDITKSIEASSDTIKQLRDSKQAARLFIELKSAEKLIRDQEKRLLQLPSPENVTEFCFLPSPAIISSLQEEKSLGTITHKKKELTLPRLSHQGDIYVKTPKDKEGCWVTGMVLLTPSRLILTDSNNKSIKMVDLNNKSVTDHLQLDTPPMDVTMVTSNQVAVTLSDKGTVQFISANSNRLSKKHKLKVDGYCCGISCYQEKLVVTFGNPRKVQIIDLKGKVLTTITDDSEGDSLYFVAPYHVTSNSHFIYVSEARMYEVLRFNWEGEPIGRYSDLTTPRGLVMLNNESILVSEKDSGNIQHISGDLSRGDIVLKDLSSPDAICWCSTDSILYISCFTDEDLYSNSIKIYKMLEYNNPL
ncbi:uncharacterized protein LOC128547505 [Mercenaria mercenaria]|uniref:uncharacterized protein LOC128547505 n=1 Tax=Mercenaria mercenaria TaxID=6596 RepID=UPI00234EFE3B|nr:uncharacterized protein LOC128547505 [Mercenaria mercenaria]